MADESRQPLVERVSRGRVDVLVVRRPEMVKADVIEALGRELRRAIDGSHAQHFVLDLAVVRYMTSAALGMIINLRAHLADRGYTLALAGATGEVAHIFECTRLADVLPVFPSADAAVHNLADPCADCDI